MIIVMARKIQPELTKANILAVSEKLFIEKGYEKTTTQEIVDLTGLSKGTIFHHFKSKEAILVGVLEMHIDNAAVEVGKWLASMEGLTAREKLILFLDDPETTPEEERETLLFKMAVATQSPQIIVAEMKKAHEKIAPIIASLIREGIKDGSITTDFPDECAQILMLLYTIWIDPLTFACELGVLKKRLLFIQHTMKAIGVDIISDQFIAGSLEFAESMI